jgi:RimJ/RimL family protein N-acetyltransferase
VLTDGRVLRVRRPGPDDLPGIRALYDELSDDDRRRRFFSSFRPPNSFFEAKTSGDDPRRFGLVAAVPGEGIVGEASYVRIPNGNAEFGITVTRRWRGWLGHYLLDALVDAAAAQGIPNLEAEILRDNRPMLALARARGFAVRSHEVNSVRLIMGTGGPTPTWTATDEHPRVLVEAHAGAWRGDAAATEAGVDALVCPGPTASSGPPSCPLLRGERCPLVDEADIVVFALDPSDQQAAAILQAHLRDRPACLAVDEQAQQHEEVPVPVGALRLSKDMPSKQILATLRELSRRPAGDAASRVPQSNDRPVAGPESSGSVC